MYLGINPTNEGGSTDPDFTKNADNHTDAVIVEARKRLKKSQPMSV